MLDVRYEIEDETLVGIELRAHGYKLAWSIGDYLENLRRPLPMPLWKSLGSGHKRGGDHESRPADERFIFSTLEDTCHPRPADCG